MKLKNWNVQWWIHFLQNNAHYFNFRISGLAFLGNFCLPDLHAGQIRCVFLVLPRAEVRLIGKLSREPVKRITGQQKNRLNTVSMIIWCFFCLLSFQTDRLWRINWNSVFDQWGTNMKGTKVFSLITPLDKNGMRLLNLYFMDTRFTH